MINIKVSYSKCKQYARSWINSAERQKVNTNQNGV